MISKRKPCSKMSILLPVVLIVQSFLSSSTVALVPGYENFDISNRAHSLLSLFVNNHYSLKFTYVKPNEKSMVVEATPPEEPVPAKVVTATIVAPGVMPEKIEQIGILSNESRKLRKFCEVCIKFMDIANEFNKNPDISVTSDTVPDSWAGISVDIENFRTKFENALNARLTVDGDNTIRVGEYPHVAALGSIDENGDFTTRCAGTIIDRKWILTAAHCIETSRGNVTTVLLGVTTIQRNTSGGSYVIKRIVQHDMFDRRSLYYDVALLELDRPINFSTSIKPACISANRRNFPEDVWMAGWGTSEHGGHMRDIMQKARLTLFNNTWCSSESELASKFPRGLPISTICGSSTGPHWRHNTCRSNSELLHTKHPGHNLFTVIGVTSFDSDCKKLWSPKIFTRVSDYSHWIENVVWPESV